ncbi:methyltransferase domain-containing protein [Dactylosporangium sp. NPDC051485]|uniref:methyltransferase domain-containing protein n=1 Tax=Dactylosporangium sp. NPDC051485 TaxID=3154846 RepID=UPI0034159A84
MTTTSSGNSTEPGTGTGAGPVPTYIFDNSSAQGTAQVDYLGQILDPHTTDILDRIGVQPGWQVLDIGPGAGSITTLLAGRVAPTGRVTAVDIKPQHVPTHPLVDIVTGDIRTVDLPGGYDLIHARLVLMHLPERADLIKHLTGLLKPGGWLVLSDWDCTWRPMLIQATAEVQAAFDTFQDRLGRFAEEHGVDAAWARTTPLDMDAAGLVEVTTVAHTRLFHGGQPGLLLHASNSRQREDALLAAGMTAAELQTLRDGMQDSTTRGYAYLMFTTVGQRPA